MKSTVICPWRPQVINENRVIPLDTGFFILVHTLFKSAAKAGSFELLRWAGGTAGGIAELSIIWPSNAILLPTCPFVPVYSVTVFA